jgi:hypothetical protein
MENWTEPAREPGQAGRPGPTAPVGPGGGLPRFPLGCGFSTSFISQKI